MDRNEILANFQAVTGIEDIGQCILQLEQCEWNFQEAVSVALAANASSPPPDVGEASSAIETMFPQFSQRPYESPSRMINFEIRMGATGKNIMLDETATLSELRQLTSVELGIPKNEAKFTGWPGRGTDHMSDDTDLKSLHLPKNVTLTVRTSASHNGASSSYREFGLGENVSIGAENEFAVPCAAFGSSSELEKLNEIYILQITNERTKTTFDLECRGSKTFEELRHDAHSLTGTPPSKQIWTGLTSDQSLLTPDRTLGSLELDRPVHKCSVSSKTEEPSTRLQEILDEEHMEVEEYEDPENPLDDFTFSSDSMANSSSSPLMPNEATDIVGSLGQFQSEFNSRYGREVQMTPNFFLDSLENAIQEAFGGPARNRRLLAVYLHHDRSIQGNVFCSQLLCSPTVVEYMASHCVIWAWDVTSDFNKKKLLDMCTRLLGSGVSDTVKRVPVDGFPMLVLAQGRGRSCEVNTIIQGNTSLDELMSKLIKAVDDADHQKQEDARMEEISEARNRIKREQEQAYQESLKQDMEKQKKIDEENAEIQRQKQEAERIEKEQNQQIEKLSQSIPDEPDPNCGEPISKIRFRPPCGGDVITRTFLASEKLQGLLNYVGSLGYLSEKYRVITSYPKRDISSLDPEMSLKDHKLYPQETLIIEERIE